MPVAKFIIHVLLFIVLISHRFSLPDKMRYVIFYKCPTEVFSFLLTTQGKIFAMGKNGLDYQVHVQCTLSYNNIVSGYLTVPFCSPSTF